MDYSFLITPTLLVLFNIIFERKFAFYAAMFTAPTDFTSYIVLYGFGLSICASSVCFQDVPPEKEDTFFKIALMPETACLEILMKALKQKGKTEKVD